MLRNGSRSYSTTGAGRLRPRRGRRRDQLWYPPVDARGCRRPRAQARGQHKQFDIAEHFRTYAEPVGEILAGLEGVSAHRAPIEEVVVRDFPFGRVALVGDAAHATSPTWPRARPWPCRTPLSSPGASPRRLISMGGCTLPATTPYPHRLGSRPDPSSPPDQGAVPGAAQCCAECRWPAHVQGERRTISSPP